MENKNVVEIINLLNNIIQDLSEEVRFQNIMIDNLKNRLAEAEAAKGTKTEGVGNE